MSKTYVICIENSEYPASLELRKIYEVVPDDEAASLEQTRIIDESGDDYLYPTSLFVPIKLPKDAEAAISRVA